MADRFKPWPAGEWRRLLVEAVTDAADLRDLLRLDPAAASTADAERQFPVRVPRGFSSRIRPASADDPLLLQILPTRAEDVPAEGFTIDPVGELRSPPSEGVLQKYRGRALVLVTSACAIHCRYCFRRHFPYDDHTVTGAMWDAAIDRVSGDPELSEVIFSGGDPLMVPDDRLSRLAHQIAAIPHVRRLRIHTRLPVVLPERVDEALVDWVSSLTVPLIVVVHANHPQEIDGDVRRAFGALRDAGATLFNQAVLLRGVNDSAEVLAGLSETLISCGVTPYYLHLLDRVQGAAHFEVPETEALHIVAELRRRLPGYLVPRLVREVAGAASKVPVDLRE